MYGGCSGPGSGSDYRCCLANANTHHHLRQVLEDLLTFVLIVLTPRHLTSSQVNSVVVFPMRSTRSQRRFLGSAQDAWLDHLTWSGVWGWLPATRLHNVPRIQYSRDARYEWGLPDRWTPRNHQCINDDEAAVCQFHQTQFHQHHHSAIQAAPTHHIEAHLIRVFQILYATSIH